MNYKQTNLSLAILGGLFAGLIASVGCEIYNVIFRFATHYDRAADSINVETLIFAPVLFSVVSGILYFIITKFLKGGRVIYTVLILLITLAVAFADFWIKLGDEFGNIAELRELGLGIILIIGGVATFILPYVTKHDIMAE